MEKRLYTRREFIATVMAGSALLVFGPSCRRILEVTTPASPTRSQVAVGLARSKDAEKMVRKAIDLAGGLPSLKPGDSVLLKPNVNSGDPSPATTNPTVIASVVKVVMEYRPKRVIVADHSNPRTGLTLDNMKKVGIYQAALQAGAEVMGLEDGEWTQVSPHNASHWKGGFSVPKIIYEVDYLITIPVVKTHHDASYSLALKNTVGLIHPRDRWTLHAAPEPHFGAMIAEVNLARPADFVIVDGTRAFVTGGPFSGEVAEPALILATPNLVAADVTGLALLKYLGTTPAVQNKTVWDQPQVSRAVELRLGVSGPEQLSLLAEGLPEVDAIKKLLI